MVLSELAERVRLIERSHTMFREAANRCADANLSTSIERPYLNPVDQQSRKAIKDYLDSIHSDGLAVGIFAGGRHELIAFPTRVCVHLPRNRNLLRAESDDLSALVDTVYARSCGIDIIVVPEDPWLWIGRNAFLRAYLEEFPMVHRSDGLRVFDVRPKSDKSVLFPAKPRHVSVVVPTYNGLHLLKPCLQSVADSLAMRHDVEVLVVDDHSSDGTSAWFQANYGHDSRFRLLENHQNLGFLRTCNKAAASARGTILVFLNNDTVVFGTWLDELIAPLEDQTVGAVGGKLLFPDGRLAEAGAVVASDGTTINVGKWSAAPSAYFERREVDYCSGALLATPSALFRSLGGFDERFAPCYYEDVDYCFQVWANGQKVLFEPLASIIHIEGGTGGTSVAEGPKQFQAANQSVFFEKWNARLAHHPAPLNLQDTVDTIAKLVNYRPNWSS
jgi:GT2 family glycosyltransferase